MKTYKRIISIALALIIMLSILPFGSIITNGAAYENTYINTGCQRLDIVGVAETQIGYKEGPNNDTKYGTWYGLPNQPWCAMFVTWCARQAGIPESILNKSAVASANPYYFNVPYYDGNTYTPKAGDLFFTKSWSHVGIVYYTDGEYFYTIEGNSNTNGSNDGTSVVSIRRKISTHYFGVPKYQNNIKLIKSTAYPVPITARTENTGKVTVYSYPEGNATKNIITSKNICTISEIYTNGWCKVSYTLNTGAKVTGYVKSSAFFPADYKVFTISASEQIPTYSDSTLSTSVATIETEETFHVIGHNSAAIQILRKAENNSYSSEWIPVSAITCTINYACEDPAQLMESSVAGYQEKFTLAPNTFTKQGHTFEKWTSYRCSDETWHIFGAGWKNESEIVSNNYVKHTYMDGYSSALSASWIRGGKTNDTITFYPTWTANTLNVCYNANSADISSNTYILNNDLICTKQDGIGFAQSWTYDEPKPNGLFNYTTFGLSKPGYVFLGWSTTPDGTTYFDQNDSTVIPTDLTSEINNLSCTIVLYAVWGDENAPKPTEKPTDIPNEIPTDTETEKPTEVETILPTLESTTPTLPSEIPTQESTEISPTTPTEPVFILGDIDSDLALTVIDSTIIQCFLAGTITVDSSQLSVADIDQDGSVSVMDATYIQLLLANLLD
ncbi:MAG: CHAP domain-containing protein [Ruminococcus sp.]|nr:CHAP domain-containing protein [Ruminococcus sp.]